jgi:hypothetical protein
VAETEMISNKKLDTIFLKEFLETVVFNSLFPGRKKRFGKGPFLDRDTPIVKFLHALNSTIKSLFEKR